MNTTSSTGAEPKESEPAMKLKGPDRTLTIETDLSTPSKAAPPTDSTDITAPLTTLAISSPNVGNDPNFKTPKKPPPKEWDDLCISPGSLIDFSVAKKAMKKDKIEEEDFYKQGKPFVKRAVHFLYGKKYKQTEIKKVRIAAIQRMVTKEDALARLRGVAFSDPRDRVSTGDAQVESYLNMAVSQFAFFQQADAFGEFPGTPCGRFQKGRNCFQPAVCIWYSLMMRQMDQSIDKNYIVDIAQRTRHHVLTSDEFLERRILQDRGYQSKDFATDILGERNLSANLALLKWAVSDFESEKPKAGVCSSYCKGFGVGLVYNFHVQDGLRAARDEPAESRVGYWLFDGDTIDTVGEFVEMDVTDDMVKLKEELRKTLAAQQDEAKKKTRERKAYVQQLFQEEEETPKEATSDPGGASGTSDPGGAPDETKDESKRPGSGVHSMVMLGGIEADFGKGKKYYFLVLNWWKSMPLILFSWDYLKVCKAKVLFRQEPPSKIPPDIETNPSLVADCESDLSDGEGESFANRLGGLVIDDDEDIEEKEDE